VAIPVHSPPPPPIGGRTRCHTRFTMLYRCHTLIYPGGPTHANIPICCGPWYNGAGHFVTFYLCPEYWSILDPLMDNQPESPRMQFKIHRALRESFTSRNLPTSPLHTYRQLPRLRPLWSYGTFAVFTTLHLLLGGIPSSPISSGPIHHPRAHDGPTQASF